MTEVDFGLPRGGSLLLPKKGLAAAVSIYAFNFENRERFLNSMFLFQICRKSGKRASAESVFGRVSGSNSLNQPSTMSNASESVR